MLWILPREQVPTLKKVPDHATGVPNINLVRPRCFEDELGCSVYAGLYILRMLYVPYYSGAKVRGQVRPRTLAFGAGAISRQLFLPRPRLTFAETGGAALVLQRQ